MIYCTIPVSFTGTDDRFKTVYNQQNTYAVTNNNKNRKKRDCLV